MNIELSILKDGGVLLVSDQAFPEIIKRVEFYRDQRLLMLVYNDDTESDLLMHYEVPDEMRWPVEKSPDVLIYMMFANHAPIGYKVPLVKVGDIY
ncbi:MAG: hypothetical protein K9G62_06775 [Alphaproteobacteria bacterium]|nr:hypothetical protein [Alphaproteobacteria bacterium]